MSFNGTLRETQPPRGIWVNFDPASRRDGPLFLDRSLIEAEQFVVDEEAEALAAEARHTGMLIAIGLPAGVFLTWILDLLAGGPGLGAMVGL